MILKKCDVQRKRKNEKEEKEKKERNKEKEKEKKDAQEFFSRKNRSGENKFFPSIDLHSPKFFSNPLPPHPSSSFYPSRIFL